LTPQDDEYLFNEKMGIAGDTLYSDWWFGTFFIFHNIWDVILPIDFHIFQMGYCTTNQKW
jgi:hypothetical protein